MGADRKSSGLAVVVALVNDLAVLPLGDDGLLDLDAFVGGGGEFHDGLVERNAFTGGVADHFVAVKRFRALEDCFLCLDTERLAALSTVVGFLQDDVIGQVSFHRFDECAFGEERENALRGSLNGRGRVWVVGHDRL